MSPTKVVIEKIEETHPHELDKSIKKRKDNGSYSKKLDFDLNDPHPYSLPWVVSSAKTKKSSLKKKNKALHYGN